MLLSLKISAQETGQTASARRTGAVIRYFPYYADLQTNQPDRKSVRGGPRTGRQKEPEVKNLVLFLDRQPVRGEARQWTEQTTVARSEELSLNRRWIS